MVSLTMFSLPPCSVTITAGSVSSILAQRDGALGVTMKFVMRKLQAVYEGGVLRPTEQLLLEERQLVSVIILDADTDDEEVEFEPAHCFEALANHSVSREAVWVALSKIPGSLDADFAAERNER